MTSIVHREPGRASLRVKTLLPVALLSAAYFALRLPFVLQQPGGQDEQLFSVPGYTAAFEGVPRIPYYPARDPQCVFYRTDDAEFALPPGLFYLQAPFFWLFPAGYPTSRLAPLMAGLAAVWLTFALARQAFGEAAGWWAASMYAGSRVLFFAAAVARPDAPCAAFGLGALLLLWNSRGNPSAGRMAATGALLGLGLLCHPFAVVYCMLCGAWVALGLGVAPAQPPTGIEPEGEGASGGRRATPGRAGRVGRALLLATVMTAAAIAVFALWLPLIAAYPEAFRKQFFNNVLRPAGPGLMQRLIWPWPYVGHQLALVREQAGAWQMWVMGSGLAAATIRALRRGGSADARRMLALIWAGLYLLTACQGMHPTKGYWCFTGALVFIAAGGAAAEIVRRTGQIRFLRWSAFMAAGLTAAVFAPQSGLRTWWQEVRPQPDSRYDGRAFVREMMAALPADGRFVVEPAFVFDFWLAGRDVVVRVEPRDYLIEQYRYDWLVVSRDGMEKGIPARLHGEFVRSFGPQDDPLACYAEVYRPGSADVRPPPYRP